MVLYILKLWAKVYTHMHRYSIVHHYNVIQFHCFTNPLCSAYSPFPPAQDPWKPLLPVSIVSPIPDEFIVEIIQHVAFSDWLLPHSYMN